MSALALRGNYELQMPNSYVDVDRDEMEYVDGGWSSSTHWWGVSYVLTGWESQYVVKALAAGAAASALGSELGIPAALAGVLVFYAAVIDLTDYAHGGNGVTISVSWLNGIPTVKSN